MALSLRHSRIPFSVSLLSVLAHFPASAAAQNGNDFSGGEGEIPGSDSTPAPTVGGSSKNTLYLIVLVALVLLGLGVAVLVVLRRRKYAAIHARARRVSDMEAARGQRALTAWRTGGPTNGGEGIPLSSRGPSAAASAAAAAGATAHPAGTGRRANRSNFFRTRGNPIVEGLNENGEAPPPYSPPEPKNEAGKEILAATDSRRDSAATVTDLAAGASNPASPSEQMAPKYEETELTRPQPTHPREGDGNQDR